MIFVHVAGLHNNWSSATRCFLFYWLSSASARITLCDNKLPTRLYLRTRWPKCLACESLGPYARRSLLHLKCMC